MTKDEEKRLSVLRGFMALCVIGVILILTTLLAVKRMWLEAILFPIGSAWAMCLVSYYSRRIQ